MVSYVNYISKLLLKKEPHLPVFKVWALFEHQFLKNLINIIYR